MVVSSTWSRMPAPLQWKQPARTPGHSTSHSSTGARSTSKTLGGIGMTMLAAGLPNHGTSAGQGWPCVAVPARDARLLADEDGFLTRVAFDPVALDP